MISQTEFQERQDKYKKYLKTLDVDQLIAEVEKLGLPMDEDIKTEFHDTEYETKEQQWIDDILDSVAVIRYCINNFVEDYITIHSELNKENARIEGERRRQLFINEQTKYILGKIN